MKIAIDAFGGDNAPVQIVHGAVLAASKYDANIVLCGDQTQIQKELNLYPPDNRISIFHCTEIIENTDEPIRAIRKKQDASMVRAMELVAKGEADGIISAGNTGALIAGSVFILKRLPGVSRPAFAPFIPTDRGVSVLLDVGANTTCDSENLYQFGVMGSLYIEKVYDKKNPKVGLLNIGVEEHKGNTLMKESFGVLKQSDLNFVGNVEARDLLQGECDVVVTDGFTGNIALKLIEGVSGMMMKNIKNILFKNGLTKLAALILRGGLNDFRKKLDYKEHGGAPLLGVNGAVIKAHGSSDAQALCAAVGQAVRFLNNDVLGQIKASLEKE